MDNNEIYFEKVSRFADVDLPMPQRATATSAGYDLCVAEDITIPPYSFIEDKLQDAVANRLKDYYGFNDPLSLDDVAQLTKELKAKVTLVSTGMKCKVRPDQYLEITARSSFPLKHWMIVANAEGIIDHDYYGNASNEGEIFFQIINLLPFAVRLHRGDKIGQGIIKTYGVTSDDQASGERVGGLGSTDNQEDQK